MTLATIPDGHRLVSDYLRAHADITALGTRIRAHSPPDRDTSWVRVTRLSAPQVNDPDHLVEFMFQFDCYAGSTGGLPEANSIARTVRAVLGSMSYTTHPLGAVTKTTVIDDHQDIDTDMDPARDRVLLTALVWIHR